jgi:asparagine synthase (glutamine-hydrolysing)
MCGIAGYIHLDGNQVRPVILRAMTDLLAHRGPDDEGELIEGAFRARPPPPVDH